MDSQERIAILVSNVELRENNFEHIAAILLQWPSSRRAIDLQKGY